MFLIIMSMIVRKIVENVDLQQLIFLYVAYSSVTTKSSCSE